MGESSTAPAYPPAKSRYCSRIRLLAWFNCAHTCETEGGRKGAGTGAGAGVRSGVGKGTDTIERGGGASPSTCSVLIFLGCLAWKLVQPKKMTDSPTVRPGRCCWCRTTARTPRRLGLGRGPHTAPPLREHKGGSGRVTHG